MFSMVMEIVFMLAVFFLLMPAVAILLAAIGVLLKQVKGDDAEHPMHLATREFYGDKLEESSAH
ncbi:hypothetical protein N9052_00035 [bacterium]|nr:hypothetical protein [bacterium]